MNTKWFAFFTFVWFIGMLMGSIFEKQNLETYDRYTATTTAGEVAMTSHVTFDYLFDFSNSKKETTIGSVFWKLAKPDYWTAWLGMVTMNFSFLKSIDPVTGVTQETIQSYLFKILGIIGVLCFIELFINVIQGFLPST